MASAPATAPQSSVFQRTPAGIALASLAGMFHASRALSATHAAHYFEAEFRRGDYYTRGAESAVAPGQWHGRACADLGLRGTVRAEDFTALLEGRAPDGTPLVQAQQATGKRRAGWDFTCSADKSVSLAALVYQDARLIAAHDDAVRRALDELETFVQTRAKGGSEVQTTGRMIAATFRHDSSRALDPQLHTHVVVANLTRRDDGQWRALYERGLFQVQRYLTAIYRAEMARSIQRLGYKLEVRRDGSVGLSGFTREQLDAFSQRRAEVLDYARERGKTTDEVGQQAALKSRAAKVTDIDPEALLKRWQETARTHGLDPRAWRPPEGVESRLRLSDLFRRKEPEPAPVDPRAAAEEAVSHALEHLSERHAAFRVDEAERVALERGMGTVSLDQVRVALAQRSDVARAGRLLTTAGAVSTEQRILDLWRAGRMDAPAVGLEHLRPGLQGEQLEAARHILTASDRVIGVEGKAGTGKSHLLASVVEAFRAAGWHVRGLAPTTGAAAVLRDNHIPAETVARFLRRPARNDQAWREMPVSRVKMPARQAWIVDEASLVSSRQMQALLSRAAAVNAKVVLVGDRMQHKSVEAGRPFEQLVEAGLRTARLDEIRRQNDPELRQAVEEAARGNAAHAVRELDRQGRVFEFKERAARLDFVARVYMHRNGSRLVTTATNEDRRDVNTLIRQARIAAGEVTADGMTAEVLVSKDLTAAQRKDVRSYDVGDHVTFRTASRVHQVTAGARGRVIEADPERKRLRVRLEDGEVVTYNPRRLSGVDVAHVEMREFAKGDRIEFRRPDKQQGIVNGQLGTVVSLEKRRRRARIRLDDTGRVVTVELHHPQAIDHGYASTSYRSQGRTVDHVIDLQDSRVASREGLYVGTSRGRVSITVVTDDRDALVRRLERAVTPEAKALDVARDATKIVPMPNLPPLAPLLRGGDLNPAR